MNNPPSMQTSRILRRSLLLALIGIAGLLPRLHAQATTLRLESCIRAAQERSPEAQIALKGFLSVYWDYRAFRASLLPQVSLDLNTPGFVRSIRQVTQNDGTIAFRQQNQAFSSANLTVSQQIAPTGGSLFVSSGLTRLDVFSPTTSRYYQVTPVLIGLNQPLFRYNALRWENRIRPIRYQLAERRYLEALEDVAVSITGKYFDVYIAQMVLQNAEFNLKITDSIYTISEGRYRVGKIAENDLLQTELAYLNAQMQVRQAQNSLQKGKMELAISLGLPGLGDIQVEQPAELGLVEVDAERAWSEAQQNRSDLLDYEARGMEAEAAVAQARTTSRFSASLNATFGLNQSSDSLQLAYRNLLDQQTATIGISIPIMQWGRAKMQVQSAEVAQDQALESIKLDQRRFERDLRFQVMDFLQLQQQLLLSAKSDTIAQRRFDVAKNRYLIGKIDITNLQIAQNEKDNARLNYVQVLRQYWVAYYQLRRATLFDWEHGAALEVPEWKAD